MKHPSVRVCCFAFASCLLCAGCSLKRLAFSSLSHTLAPFPEGELDAHLSDADFTRVFTEEDDLDLVAQSLPLVLKVYEALHLQNPAHRGLSLAVGRLYIMYANAFVQTPAQYLPEDEFEAQNEAYSRARKLYLRGARYALSSLETAYPGFTREVFSGDEQRLHKVLSRCTRVDVGTLYWVGTGYVAAFALTPLGSALPDTVHAAVMMLERACDLWPSYQEGAVWNVLTKFYAAAPESFGGGMEKAHTAFEHLTRYCSAHDPDHHITYADALCIPLNNRAGFDEALDRALAIDPESVPHNKLLVILSQKRARWLKAHVQDFLLD